MPANAGTMPNDAASMPNDTASMPNDAPSMPNDATTMPNRGASMASTTYPGKALGRVHIVVLKYNSLRIQLCFVFFLAVV